MITDPGDEGRPAAATAGTLAAGKDHGQHSASRFKWSPSERSTRIAGIVTAVCTVAVCLVSVLALFSH